MRYNAKGIDVIPYTVGTIITNCGSKDITEPCMNRTVKFYDRGPHVKQ